MIFISRFLIYWINLAGNIYHFAISPKLYRSQTLIKRISLVHHESSQSLLSHCEHQPVCVDYE